MTVRMHTDCDCGPGNPHLGGGDPVFVFGNKEMLRAFLLAVNTARVPAPSDPEYWLGLAILNCYDGKATFETRMHRYD